MNWEAFITCAVTGSGDTVGKHPAIPKTPQEIADSAIEAAKAGAAVAHTPVRDPASGKPSRDPPLFNCFPFPFQRPDPGADRGHTLLQASYLSLQCGDLGFVGPAEDIACAVVQTMAVVLFVTIAASFHLPGSRERLRLPPEVIERIAAGVVKSARQFSFKPGIER